ncbi:Exostosin family protein [compost metagenome]
MPPFIKDPYLFLDKEVEYLNKESRLRIGFVGHSATGIIKIAKEFLIFANGVLKRFVRKDPTDYQFFYPSSFFRFQYLNFLKKNEKITCDFILRNQYRAGAKTEEDKYNTSYEFFKNIHNNPYTFCLRGGGNFSVRFYETLAMGRIPVLIDTDCQLPFFETINWSEHCLIVSEYEAEKLPQKLLDFHSNLSSEDFLALQEKNRMLWEKRLTKEMFFQELAKHLNQIL